MDFPAKLTIEVTADDIAKGRASSCVQCPIALAAKKAFLACHPEDSGSYYLTVTRDLSVYPTTPGNCLCVYSLPQEALNFIGAFDDNEPVKPFTFKATRLWPFP